MWLDDDKRPVALLLRCSSESKNDSIEAQRGRMDSFAKIALKREQVIWFDEGYISGSKLEFRPVFKEALRRIAGGEFKAMYALEYTRYTRSEDGDADHIVKTFSHGNCLIGIPGNLLNLSTSMDKFIFRMQINNSLLDKDFILDRTARGKIHAMQLGKIMGQTCLKYGYKTDKETKFPLLDESESLAVREMFELAAQGHSPYEISEQFNAAGIHKTRYALRKWKHIKCSNDIASGKWRAPYIWDLLNCEAYIGDSPVLFEFKSPYRETIKVLLPQIISRELYDKAHERMKERRRVYTDRKRETKHYYLLQQLVECKNCGCTFYVDEDKARKVIRYFCSGRYNKPVIVNRKVECTGNRFVDGQFIESFVWDNIIIGLFTNPQLLEEAFKRRQTDIPNELKKVAEKMKEAKEKENALVKQEQNLLTFIAESNGQIDSSKLISKLSSIQIQLKDWRLKIDCLNTDQNLVAANIKVTQKEIAAFSKEIATRIRMAGLKEKRELVKLLIERVILDVESITKKEKRYNAVFLLYIPLFLCGEDSGVRNHQNSQRCRSA